LGIQAPASGMTVEEAQRWVHGAGH